MQDVNHRAMDVSDENPEFDVFQAQDEDAQEVEKELEVVGEEEWEDIDDEERKGEKIGDEFEDEDEEWQDDDDNEDASASEGGDPTKINFNIHLDKGLNGLSSTADSYLRYMEVVNGVKGVKTTIDNKINKKKSYGF